MATTAERGLGTAHQAQRRMLLAAHIDGTPCVYCGGPMSLSQDLDADHSIPRSRGGTVADRLVHRTCNQSAGGKLAHLTDECPHHRTCGSYHSRAW